LLPDIIRSLIEGQDIILRNPRATRPWQHVLDPLNGYLSLAEHLYKDGPGFSEGWNFGPAESQPVFQVVDQLLSLWGSHISLKHDKSYQPHEDPYLMLDSTKARVKLGWKPALDLKTSLSWVVEWVKCFQERADIRTITEAQIRRYMDILENSGISHQRIFENARTEQTLASSDALLKQADLFDLMHETIMIREIGGRISFWNRGANEMYGWTKEEAIGNISHTLLQTRFPESLKEIEIELVRKGRWEGQLVHTKRNGSPIVVKSRWVLNQDHQSEGDKVLEINQIRHYIFTALAYLCDAFFLAA
jgi:PAS domain S-box-containing protein